MPIHPEPSISQPTLDGLFAEGAQAARRYEESRGGAFHGFVPADYQGAYEALRSLRDRADSFLELGSGVGVITILADLLGFDAYGIEIEDSLVESSRSIAEAHDSDARFTVGSFVPDELRQDIEHLDPDFHLTLDGESAYPELGLDLGDFDLVYAFPWPGEAEFFARIARACGRDDALYMTYGGTDGFEVRTMLRA